MRNPMPLDATPPREHAPTANTLMRAHGYHVINAVIEAKETDRLE